MGVWIMSVVGVICLGLLLEIVLPEGQTAKYVKGAFSLLIVFVIAAPLPNLLGKDLKLKLDSCTFEVDGDYINATYSAYSQGTAKSIEKYLLENGYVCDVDIVLKDATPAAYERIDVAVRNFKAQVADAVSKEVRRLITERLKCDERKVNVYVISKSGV